jgi:aminoglycoside phosphotransferase (APT) family kinase protein
MSLENAANRTTSNPDIKVVQGTLYYWFYVKDMIEGRIFWDARVPSVSYTKRAAIFDAMNATITKLHMLDYKALGLGDYGRPGNYFERQIGRKRVARTHGLGSRASVMMSSS